MVFDFMFLWFVCVCFSSFSLFLFSSSFFSLKAEEKAWSWVDRGSGEDLHEDMGRETVNKMCYMETFIFNLKKIAGAQKKPKINKWINLPQPKLVSISGVAEEKKVKCKKAF